jgi:hypothetical protein
VSPDVSLIDLYLFLTGRRLHALAGVREAIVRGAVEGEAPLRARVDAAIAFDEDTYALEERYSGQSSRAEHAPEARGIDIQLDRTLTAFESSLEQNERAFPSSAPIHVSSRTVRVGLLPRGAAAITQLECVLELEAVGALLRGAAKPELAPHVDTAQVRAHIAQLGELHPRFAAAIGGGQRGAIGYDKVRAANAIGQRNLLRVVAWVLGNYLEDEADHVAARERLLGPILKQNEEIGREHARTGVVTDVDPVTGEPVRTV